MKYRSFGRLAWKGSALGFGCMRLPTIEGDSSAIDEPESIRMLRYAIDRGVNHVDTAYGYHGGSSERLVGKALQDGYRDRVKLATKLPCWLVKEAADFDRLLNEQLDKLQASHVDRYLLHSLGEKSWHKVRDLNVIEWAEGAIADGRIGCLGFSFHDKYAVFREIVDAYDDWTFCQIQYNYMNEEEQAGTKGLEYAASKGLAVVIMEPLLGGRLANPPQPIQDIWNSASVQRSPAEWAFRWLWNKPEVSIVLSGMNTMEQVEQNVASADTSAVQQMTDAEFSLVAQVRDKYHDICPIPCTQCKYCVPCPNGVDIPRNFDILNNGVMYGLLDEARKWYARVPEEARASACVQCRQCEELCPQSILISEWMPTVHAVLYEGHSLDECLGT